MTEHRTVKLIAYIIIFIGVILLLISPLLVGNANSTSICSVPINKELRSCPRVREIRVWVAEDGSWATCKLNVCGQSKTWTWRNNKWKRDWRY